VLDVSNNRLSKVEHLGRLSQLQDLWLNDNALPTLDGLQDALSGQRHSLTTIYLENNPAAAAPDYKARVLDWFPHLAQLDADVLEVLDQIHDKLQQQQAQAQQARQRQRQRQAQPGQQQQQQNGTGGAAD
jgi:hypothetical protein